MGTFLQNRNVLDVVYREGYTDVEMEAGPYLSAIYELFRPQRHPVDEIVSLYGLPFDLGILHKEDREMGIAESLKLSVFYIAIAMAFGVWVWIEKGVDLGMKYYTGYFIEKALSIDNVFVISLIFTFFAIPPKYQYRALLWGILAVIVLRAEGKHFSSGHDLKELVGPDASEELKRRWGGAIVGFFNGAEGDITTYEAKRPTWLSPA